MKMVEVMSKFDSIVQAVVRAVLVVFCVFSIEGAGAGAATLKGLTIGDGPAVVRATLSERVPFKVIKVDGKEVLIALKNVDTPEITARRGKPGALVRDVTVQGLANGVLALVVSGQRPFKGVSSGWEKTGATLVVSFADRGGEHPRPKTPKPLPVKRGAESKPPKSHPDASLPGPDLQKTSAQPAAFMAAGSPGGQAISPPSRPASIYRGDMEDILVKADLKNCRSSDMDGAVTHLKKRLWNPADELLARVVEAKDPGCLEPAYYLRGYAALMAADPDDSRANLTAMAAFQDALVAYPDSTLLPFALAGLGIVQARLKNPAAAEGFFAIIRDDYRDYPGLAQVLYHLGLIYEAKGYNDQALAYFKEVFEDLPENSSVVDAGIGIGKALFKKRFYIDSLKILTGLIQSNPEKTYDSPDLLLSIGRANFELGRTAGARENLLRAMNLFPGITGKDTILADVAETYAVEKNNKRAESLYRLVIKTFPGGEGFLNSSMGLALLVTDMAEKKAIYEMVKRDFPDHHLASVAMMRLAEIYEKEGAYSKCIEEIENLLATHPQGLRYEAVKLMQRAYETLFDGKMDKGLYPDVLQTFERKNALFERMESRKVYLSAGLAYLEARLHEQAFNQLIKAYKLYARDERPEALLFGLGAAMDETGRKEDALKIFTGFVKRFPASARAGLACLRMGNILLEKKMFAKAEKILDAGYEMTKDGMERGNILLLKGEVFKAQKEWPRASIQLVAAAKAFALAPGDHYDLLAATHIKLGESYLEQKHYVKAAEAFAMALKFTGGEQTRADVGFMLGDAYQKANVLTKAREAFERIVSLDDSIWARLARERLATLDLAEKVKES